MYKKGQYFSFDAIVASVIFVLALVALLSYWHSVRTYLDYQNSDISREAVRISTVLFSPAQGHCLTKDLSRMGFANSWNDQKFNSTLFHCADKMNTEEMKASLGTPFRTRIVLTNITDTSQILDMGFDPKKDLKPKQDPTQVVKMHRIATVENQDGTTHIVNIDIYLYRLSELQ